ncbi:hypothetical protein SAMN04487990_11461 [Bizionia paragorgiae]|jgi:hypothetical protein|uniref:Uncharacterized protein n=1 Tax=Bizionia paragorgiae TaxID=283786 RepID=A0A1H4BFJ4_BIZPA|nr:hypothetical protein SAMN04487990_11461 [Bizionia paragorgiae]
MLLKNTSKANFEVSQKNLVGYEIIKANIQNI